MTGSAYERHCVLAIEIVSCFERALFSLLPFDGVYGGDEVSHPLHLVGARAWVWKVQFVVKVHQQHLDFHSLGGFEER